SGATRRRRKILIQVFHCRAYSPAPAESAIAFKRFGHDIPSRRFLRVSSHAYHFFGVGAKVVHDRGLFANSLHTADGSVSRNKLRAAAKAGEAVDHFAPGNHVGVYGDRVRTVKQDISGENDVAVGDADDEIGGSVAGLKLDNAG